MRRKQIVIFALITWGVVYLFTLWEVSVRSWSSQTTIQHQVKTVLTSEQLTWRLFISPWWAHDALLDILSEAKYTIDIRWYQISDKQLIQLLKNKAKSGVKVRVILENSMHGNETKDWLSFYQQTKDSGIEVKSDEWLGTNYVHAKTFIIDNESFVVSTANSTYPWFFSNREYRFITQQKNYATLLSKGFDADRQWERRQSTLPDNLRVCPFNCRSSIKKFIQQATTRIDIQAQYLEDQEVIDLLRQKITQWVTVRLVFGKYQEDILPTELKQVSRQQADPNIHAKNILIDGKEMYIWSMNLSANAMDNNREIWVVTTDHYALASFVEQFNTDWATKAIPYQ